MTHGCSAKVAVLPGEDPEERLRRREAWCRDLGAVTEPERQLVETAVDASCCMDRVRLAEVAALTRQVHEIDVTFEDALAADVERLTGRLMDEPAVVRQLRKSSLGCRWLVGQWTAVAFRLEEFRWIEGSQRRLTTALLGKLPTELFTDPTLLYWVSAYLATIVGNTDVDPAEVRYLLRNDFSEAMSSDEVGRRVDALVGGLSTAEEGCQAMKKFVAGMIDELTERLDLVEAREDRDRALAIDAARFDASAEGARRLRYKMAHERTLRASLRELRALQAARPEQSANLTSAVASRSALDEATAIAPTEATAIAPTDSTAIAPTEATAIAPTEATAVAPTEATPIAASEATAVSPTEDDGPATWEEAARAIVLNPRDPVTGAIITRRKPNTRREIGASCGDQVRGDECAA